MVITPKSITNLKSYKIFNLSILILLCFGVLISILSFATPTLAASDTRYDSGLNLPFNEKAGNVNPQTGVLTQEVTDLELPGRNGFNFKLDRVWNLNQANIFTMYRDSVDGSNKLNSETLEKYNRMGVGWSRNIPYIFTDTSSGIQVINLCFNGGVYQLDTSGLALYNSRTNPDKSNVLWYDLLDMRVYQEAGIKYGDYPDLGLLSDYGIVDQAQTQNKYVLILKDNSHYWFRSDGQLMMQEDRTGLNRIWYFYDSQSRLKLVVDTADRRIRFNYDSNGNLATVQWDVTRGVKDSGNLRVLKTETYQISYHYESTETYSSVSRLKPNVINYRQPFRLESITDPEGNVTHYKYSDGPAYFSYDSSRERSQNVYLLLKEMVTFENTEGKFKNKQCFEYVPPAQGLYSKDFYQGYIEYYKISRQYNEDRNGRVMNDTTYLYHNLGDPGYVNQYSTVLQQGNVKSTYIYTISDDKSQDNVLDKLQTESNDGFREEQDFVYNANRAKIETDVYRGPFIYREKYDYDLKGNLKWYQDKMGLETVTQYDDKYSLPIQVVKKLEVDGTPKEYESENIINPLGQVDHEIVYLEQPNGSKRAVVTTQNQYDSYGNLIKVTDALGKSVNTVYDLEHHLFPIKVYQDVTIASWQNGAITDTNWITDPDGSRAIRLRSWKAFNSDGSVWLEIDNEGYAIEHYYDKNGSEIETVIPDSDDIRYFSQIVTVTNGQPNGPDFEDFLTNPFYNAFLMSRQNNPKVRQQIFYTEDLVKTFTDLNVKKGEVKVTGKQSDGLGHVEEEIEYDANGNEYSVKRMSYDLLGRMVGLTDPDAGTNFYLYSVNGVTVPKYDKTWITEYDDLGRKKWITYPETTPGQTDSKQFSYDDQENSVTVIDPSNRKTYEKRDWNNNLTKTIRYGDRDTKSEEIQEVNNSYDKLNRLVKTVDPNGLEVTYHYDERNLLLKETYGTTGSDLMEYDDLGLLVKKTDRKGQIIVMTYDEMKRNTAVDYLSGKNVRTVNTVYNNRGNAVRISSNDLIEYYSYDHNNRVTKLQRQLKDDVLRKQVTTGTGLSEVYSFSYTYNDAGMVTKMTYPDNAVHKYQYDGSLGRLQQLNAVTDTTQWIKKGSPSEGIQPFVTSLSYTPSGVVNRMAYANQTVQTWDFNNRKWISRIQVNGPGYVLEDLNYTLNGSGDILTINDNEYKYDGFDRISGAKTLLPGHTDTKKLVVKCFGTYKDGDTVNGFSYLKDADLNNDGRINGDDHTIASLLSDDSIYDDESFTYDKNGNRTQLDQNGDIYTYQYGDRNKLDTIYLKKKGATASHLYIKFTYDDNGNTTSRMIYTDSGQVKTITTFEYDTLNRLLKSTQDGKITEYLYDNAGNRFIKKSPNGTITLYLRHGQTAVALDIELPASDPTFKAKINRYVLSGDLLAGRITRNIKLDGTEAVSVSYYHLDHLNSTKCVTDTTGKLEVDYVYRAFGAQLAKLGNGDSKYTYGGKELDSETNLYYFNARFYDAEVGRFITEDPAKDGLNWYGYCENNPLRFVESDGVKVN